MSDSGGIPTVGPIGGIVTWAVDYALIQALVQVLEAINDALHAGDTTALDISGHLENAAAMGCGPCMLLAELYVDGIRYAVLDAEKRLDDTITFLQNHIEIVQDMEDSLMNAISSGFDEAETWFESQKIDGGGAG